VTHYTIVAVPLVLVSLAIPVAADPITLLPSPTTVGRGETKVITYSYSNLLDGTFLLMNPEQLRAATEEALGLWASFGQLRFVEVIDSGPAPSDFSYTAGTTPQIRIGHHPLAVAAHAYFPNADDGLGSDVHFDSGGAWNLNGGPWNFLEAATHELGHAIGLQHELERIAIMNPFYPQQRFSGLGTSFLYAADIEQLQSLYEPGRGSVTPLAPTPEPGTLMLAAAGLALLACRRRGWL